MNLPQNLSLKKIKILYTNLPCFALTHPLPLLTRTPDVSLSLFPPHTYTHADAHIQICASLLARSIDIDPTICNYIWKRHAFFILQHIQNMKAHHRQFNLN
ncbi:hypothetical protein L1049_005991 [Liquidambar formosana]|uniref:Uncharacterized protein n=1 Tax=Liquidambar formosana TaxID=63359 RepID=A0AAP0WSX0_LIQFO